ncbi:glutamate 5-kinase [Clostridium sp. Marseille-Q7071]
MKYRESIKKSKRIIIKIGTSTLTYSNGNINLGRIEKIAMSISDLINSGKEVILVTSGAIGVGVSKMHLKKKPKTIREKQAAASVGQVALMNIYSKLFGEYGYSVGQILLTRDNIESERSRNNVVNTFETLLESRIIPIVNENDSVSIDEIENVSRFGDNDNLAAIVSTIVNADLLVILSDIDGFYDSNPRTNKDAKFIKEVKSITDEVQSFAEGAGSNLGTGGMETKIYAAKRVTDNGTNMILANGKDPSILIDILNGEEVGTLFLGKEI